MQKLTSQTPRDVMIYIKKGLVVILLVEMAILASLNPGKGVSATGDGSPAECENPSAKSEGNADSLSYTAPAGNTISGICIKSGTNMFGGTSHSGLLGNGTYENGCYTVSGVGTDTVTVDRTGTDSPTCQGLSHIDIFFSLPPTPTPSPTPSSTPESSPSPTPTPSPTPEITPTPSPTTTTTTTTGGGTAVAGASAENNPGPTPTPESAVLGASAQLPETGTATTWLLLALLSMLSGSYLTFLGFKKN